ncbi:HMA2 domain-containing protein [Nostoc sp. CCY 9925]|uniref:HMA2 domain-containing protein n=1 Tax=Nostoc sp. CCY 9925 TaxID=3103865 RepID=UPI0039C68795
MLTNSHGNLTEMPKIIEQKALSNLSKLISAKIVSNTPGRLRLRVALPHRQNGEIQRIANALAAQPHINQVRTNIHHGSIAIEHDAKDDTLKNVVATLTDLGVIFADITEGNSEAAVGITNAVFNLNKKVELATKGEIDLRVIFPLGLSILAVRQLLAKGLQFEIIPWYVLAWYAFDSFIKLHGVSKPQSTSNK